MKQHLGVIPLTFLIYPCRDTIGRYVAHCLEMDVVGVEDTIPKAIELLKELIEELVLAALADGTLPKIMRPAPLKYWRWLAEAKPYEPPRRVVRHKIAAEPISRVDYALAPT